MANLSGVGIVGMVIVVIVVSEIAVVGVVIGVVIVSANVGDLIDSPVIAQNL